MQGHDSVIAGVVESKDDLIIVDEHRVQEGFDQPLLAGNISIVHTGKLMQEEYDMLVLPYHPAERTVPTPNGFDGTYYPDGLENTPRRYAIVRTNRIMVDTCDWRVCYVRHGTSNSRNLLEYAQYRAKKKLIRITNICENEDGSLIERKYFWELE